MDFDVSGMSCGHCVRAITDAVTPIPGVSGVAVDLAAGRVRIDGVADPGAVRAAIEAEGYEARLRI